MKLAFTLTPIGVAAAALATACASAPIPADKIARSEAALKSAEVVNTQDVPAAEYHLRLARTEMHEARKLLMRGENEQASRVLLRAESDAEVALNVTRESDAKREAQAMIVRVQQMKVQLEGPKS